MTVQDFLELLDENQTYMVCPYNAATADILSKIVIDRNQDKVLEDLSDDYEDKCGDNYSMHEVVIFGVIRIEDTIEYENYSDSYLLILTNIIGGN